MTTVYLVKRQHFSDTDEWIHDELIDVCSSVEKALIHVDRPNFDIIITSYVVDGGPDSEILIGNIESYRK